MELLGRIVPAIRETRVPLITGYAWLFVIWLAFIVTDTGQSRLPPEPEPGSLLAVTQQALNALGGLGLGITVSVAAFMVGSLTGYLFDRVLTPLDVRALRDHAARNLAEAQLRFQLALPLTVGVLVVRDKTETLWWLVGLAIPAGLTLHGQALWRRAKQVPLKADLVGVDLSDAYLVGANCTLVDMTGANLQGSNLTGALPLAALLFAGAAAAVLTSSSTGPGPPSCRYSGD